MLTLQGLLYMKNTFDYFNPFLASFNGNNEIHLMWLPYLKDCYCIFLSVQTHQNGPQFSRVKSGKCCGHLTQQVTAVLSLTP